jgi:hypothetical protein
MDYCASMRPALREAILESSVSSNFRVATGEWYVNYYLVVDGVSCVCGQENCKYIYSIKNRYNEKTLFPIGSSCMEYFNWNEEEAEIISAYNKWHEKLYNNEGGQYNQTAFNEVIKDVGFIRRLVYSPSAENRRLYAYAKAVWIHNPPAVQSKKKEPSCEKCQVQKEKGYPRCYQCHLKKKSLKA